MDIRTLIVKARNSAVVRHVLVDAALGVACGALYGMVFSGFKGIGANDVNSLALGAVCLGGLGGIAVAIGGLCFSALSTTRPDSQSAPIR